MVSYHIRAQAALGSLHNENDKKIYAFINDHAKDIIHMAVAEAAEACGVSNAALVRYAQKLGYKGYQAMKINIAQETISPEQQIYGKLSASDTMGTIAEKLLDSHMQALQDTKKILQPKALELAVRLITGCQRLLIYGMGGSGSVALDCQHKFLKIGKLALAYTDSNLQAMSAATLAARDVVIAITHSGASKDILQAVEIARHAKASVIAITNYGKSPICEMADVVLFTASAETAFQSDALSSRIAELAILDSLYIGTAFQDYDASYANITKTRNALDAAKI